MKWLKKGCIIEPGWAEWAITHAQNPFTEHIEGSRFKIHFAARDSQNRARGGYASIDMNTLRIIELSKIPTLDLGTLGCFDDCGVMPSCIVEYNEKKYMYYTGWKKEVTTPFSFFIGLCISEDGGKTYHRYSLAPLLGRNYYDPYLTASPWVMIEEGKWRMWYVSCTGWEVGADDRLKHYYHIKYAESEDGITWNTGNVVCIDFEKGEYAIARPVVYKENGLYVMWYCYRGGKNTYRAGYAESSDGIHWQRKDQLAGIDVSENDWDSDMICYPYLFEDRGQKYMLYNGNSFGATGCGLAALEKE